MKTIGELAAESIKTGRRLEAFDRALLAMFQPDQRATIRAALRLKPQFNENVLSVAAAVDWCETQQHRDDMDVAEEAASTFGVEFDQVMRAWRERNWQDVNEARRVTNRNPVSD